MERHSMVLSRDFSKSDLCFEKLSSQRADWEMVKMYRKFSRILGLGY